MEFSNMTGGAGFDAQKWSLVTSRNRAADFVYAVSTTGIFCRPSCPSRRPAANHVRFFSSSAEAMAAGYRPCKRCEPVGERPDEKMAARICRYLELRLDQSVSLADLARQIGRSPFTIQRQFRKVVGVSPRQFQAQLRLAAARRELAAGTTVTDAVYQAGYTSSSRFYERASKSFGMKPGTFRKGAKGVSIHFATAPCAVGILQVAATEKGLCSVMLGDDADKLEQELRKDFRGAELRRGGCEAYLQGVLEMMDGKMKHNGLPVDIRATAFQARVWQALQEIPRGETRTYSGVAGTIGKPRAVRAVARACALNPISIVVPCHRVIGRDGSLTGYRWGLDRKRKLLEMEGDSA